jgi:hypothetical protein
MVALIFWCNHLLMNQRYGLMVANFLQLRVEKGAPCTSLFDSSFWVTFSFREVYALSFCFISFQKSSIEVSTFNCNVWLMSRAMNWPELYSSLPANMLTAWSCLAFGPFLFGQVTQPLLETSCRGYLPVIPASTYSYILLLKYFAPIMNCGKQGMLSNLWPQRNRNHSGTWQ